MSEEKIEEFKDATYYLYHPEEVMPDVADIPAANQEAEPVKTDTQVAEQEAEAAKSPEDKPAIQAKDGTHTIPYAELEKSREEARAAKEEAEHNAARIAELEKERDDLQAARDAKAGEGLDTSEEDQKLAEFDEEFPSISEIQDLKLKRESTRLEKLISAQAKQIEELQGKVAPLRKATEDQAIQSHFDTIYAAHDDYDSIVEKLPEYAEALPYKQAVAALNVIKEGTAKEVIELVNAYKAAQKPAPKPAKIEVEDRIPSSLSDIAGANAMHHRDLAAMSQMELIAYSQSGQAQYNEVQKYINSVM